MTRKKLVRSVAAACLILAGQSCIPSHLEKYSLRSSRAAAGPGGDLESESALTAGRHARTVRQNPQKLQRPQIYAIDRQTYRFHLAFDNVWDTALNVLLKNYNLTIVDRNSGIITTEWDTFFINQEVYRNRVSMRISRVGRATVDVIVHNNVERLQDSSSVGAGTIGSIWLPSEDVGDETNRLMQNIAIAMNMTPPSNVDQGRVAKQFE